MTVDHRNTKVATILQRVDHIRQVRMIQLRLLNEQLLSTTYHDTSL